MILKRVKSHEIQVIKLDKNDMYYWQQTHKLFGIDATMGEWEERKYVKHVASGCIQITKDEPDRT
jgi:hypothetical protein